MEKSSKTVVGASKDQRVMTDINFAQELIQETFPIRAGRNVKAAIGSAFHALKQRERALPREVIKQRPRQWTERRVRSLWNGEARRIDYYEIEDLTAVAVEEAKNEFARSKARQERLAALLAHPSAYQGRELAHLVRERVGGMDSAGTGVNDDRSI